MTERVWSNLSDGTGQDSRFPAALEEGYFSVDELTFEQLLAMGADFAAVINYYNLKNQRDGSWARLFESDEAVIMAQILSTDTRRLETEFAQVSEAAVPDQLGAIYAGVERIDGWFKGLNSSDHRAGMTLSWKIAELIKEKLSGELHPIGATLTRDPAGVAMADASRLGGLSSLWGVVRDGERYSFPKAAATPRPRAQPLSAMVGSAARALSHGIAYLQRITPPYLEASLQSQAHNPAMGLFMAFLKLCQKVQAHTNRHTQRHLNFYYHDLLKAELRSSLPRSVYVTLASGVENLSVPAGSPFSAGKDAAGKDQIYVADQDIAVSDAKLVQVCSLSLARDKSISPERELDFIARARAGCFYPNAAVEVSAWPLFETLAEEVGGAEIGFAVASSVLLMREGQREVEVTIKYLTPPEVDAERGVSLLALLQKTKTEGEFFTLLGKILSRYLLAHDDWLSDEHKRYIVNQAERKVGSSALKVIRKLFAQERLDLFYQLFRKAFTISVTTELGWHTVRGYAVSPYRTATETAQHGLRFVFNLGPDVAAVVPYVQEQHGGDWETALPLIRFLINDQAHFYPFSLLHALTVQEVVIQTQVQGIKDLLAYNNFGQLDPGAPWHPFGPAPSPHSYFVLGNMEAAKKSLVAMRFNIEWGELPRELGGFAQYYEGYDSNYANDCFKVTAAVFRDGEWLPGSQEPSSILPLFETTADSDRVSVTSSLDMPGLKHCQPLPVGMTKAAYRYDLKARDGFFKFTLSAPDGAFGHREYTSLLTRVLTENARLKKLFKPLPNPPYTPLINRISLDYTARSVISAKADSTQAVERLQDAILHIQPFGSERAFPAQHPSSGNLLPRYVHDGNLYLGMTARRLGGILTLMFDMGGYAKRSAFNEAPAITWFYLVGNQWRRLDTACVLSDTTLGFLSSGIITLDIPNDIDRDHTTMPGGLYWLRVSSDVASEAFCHVRAIQTHGLKLKGSTENVVDMQLTGERIQRALMTLPGLSQVQQVGEVFGGRQRETDPELKTRISERLRHKQRALSPWDYERLILQRYPEIYKVKCLPNMRSDRLGDSCAGQVMIVVVPYRNAYETKQVYGPKVKTVALKLIQDYISDLAPPFANIEVRNPIYERIQVRCTVKFTRSGQTGRYLERLNQAIVEYLLPWHDGGYQATFGWCIRREDVESYIRELDYVDFITNFSMLHITRNDEGFSHLEDTARPGTREAALYGAEEYEEIVPRYPWSLAIPVKTHFIETMDAISPIPAQPTGIDELEVGNTLIINTGNSHG